MILDVGLMLENSAVFQAQVVDQVVALNKLGFTAAVLCASKDRAKFHAVAGQKLEKHKVTVYLISDNGLIKNIFSFTKELKRLKNKQDIGRIYIRGFWAAFPILLASPLGRLNYVYDVRGDVLDESVGRGGATYRRFLIRMLEAFALRCAHHVTSVTKPLALLVMTRARLKMMPEVIPSCIDLSDFCFNESTRSVRRIELGYTDEDIVLVYSGGLARYQMIEEMLALWRGMLPLNNHIKFLLLINSDPPSLERSVGDLDDFGNRLTILNLPRSEVFSTLSAADIGFLLREDRVLNATASPVKFAEYLAAGLAVVSSPGVGDLSERITERKLGTLLKPLKKSPEVDKLDAFINIFVDERAAFRQRALLAARDKYSWEAHRNTYQELYSKVKQK